MQGTNLKLAGIGIERDEEDPSVVTLAVYGDIGDPEKRDVWLLTYTYTQDTGDPADIEPSQNLTPEDVDKLLEIDYPAIVQTVSTLLSYEVNEIAFIQRTTFSPFFAGQSLGTIEEQEEALIRLTGKKVADGVLFKIVVRVKAEMVSLDHTTNLTDEEVALFLSINFHELLRLLQGEG